MQDSGLTDAYANFHFSLLHCNYLIPSNTTLPSTERHSEIKQTCTYPQEEHVADNLCRAVTPDLAAFQIFGLAFSSVFTRLYNSTDSRVHRQTHDPWVSQGNLVCLPSCPMTYIGTKLFRTNIQTTALSCCIAFLLYMLAYSRTAFVSLP